MGEFSRESFILAIEESGLKKAEIARRMGVSPQTFNDYQKGTPSLETWNKFHKAIGKENIKPYYSAFDNFETTTQVQEDETRYQPSGPSDLVSQLTQLADLFKLDLLTKDEYLEAKSIVIKKFKNS